MQTSKFEEIVQQHAEELKKREAENAVDWNERKEWWQQRVTQLLDQIQGWLTPLIRSNTVMFTRPMVSRAEETLGTYDVPSGLIQLGQEKLRLLPVASVIVGGFGRVDIDGPNGSVMFILSAPDQNVPRDQLRSSSAWFVSHPKQRRELRRLTKETFEQVFADLFGIVG